MVTVSKFESLKSRAVAPSTRRGANRQLRFSEITGRAASPDSGRSAASPLFVNAAAAAAPPEDFRNSLRSIASPFRRMKPRAGARMPGDRKSVVEGKRVDLG